MPWTADDLASFFDLTEHGVAATWLPSAGGSVSTVVTIEEQALDISSDDAPASTARREAIIRVRLDQVAAPVPGDGCTIAAGDHAGTWRVHRRVDAVGGVASLACWLDTFDRVGRARLERRT